MFVSCFLSVCLSALLYSIQYFLCFSPYLRFFRLEDAFAYLQFILESIHQKELFHSIEIEPKSCWEYLIWMDQHNYGGIIGQMPDSGTLFGDEETDMAEENSEDRDEGIKDGTQVSHVGQAP